MRESLAQRQFFDEEIPGLRLEDIEEVGSPTYDNYDDLPEIACEESCLVT